MKKSTIQFLVMLIITLTLQVIVPSLWAQSPQKMSYQAVIRNSSDKLVVNQKVGMQISILKGSETGTVVYTETQKPTTNINGLVSVEIGTGTTSDNFSAIDWANGPYFIKTATDPTGGTTYTINGVSQLLSVPYALYAKNVENDKVNDADADPTNEIQELTKSGNVITLSKGGGTVSIDDADADPTNEIQSLSISGTSLTLSKGGGTVTLPSSGGGDNWGTQSVVSDVTISGNGTTGTPLKIAQQSAATGEALKWNGTAWKPGKVDSDSINELQALSLSGNSLTLSKGGGTVSLPTGADNWGTQSVVTDATFTGNGLTATPLKLAQQSATAGQGLKWNGTAWRPGNVDSDSLNEIQTISISGSNISLSKGGGSVTLPASEGLTLPYVASGAFSSSPFSIENTGSAFYTITGLSSSGYGIYGRTSASNGGGVYGVGTGSNYSAGVVGRSGEGTTTQIPGNCGVLGQANANLGVAGTAISGIGGYFYSSSGLALNTVGNIKLTGIGESAGRVLTCDVNGNATWQIASAGGLTLPYSQTISNSSSAFEVTNSNSVAIHGVNSSSSSGSGIGVKGESSSSNGAGVWGENSSSTGSTYGVYGTVNSVGGVGVYGVSPYVGVEAFGTGSGSYGSYSQGSYIGAEGFAMPASGINYGVAGISQSTSGTGVYGSANASSGTTYGVHGISSSSSGIGVFGEGNTLGVKGVCSDDHGTGTSGSAPYIGVSGNASGTSGTNYGVYGSSSSNYGFGVYGSSSYVGIYGYCSDASGWGGFFSGKVGISGSLGVGSAYPSYPLEVAGCANLNFSTTGTALRCNGAEAIWFNGTYFSWGYGGSWNYFGDKVFIGATATDPGSNLLVVNGAVAKPGGGSWATWSDIRLKDLHGNFNRGLKEIIKLQPVNYSYKKDNIKNLPSDKNYVGFVAQEVQKVFPEAVTEEKDGYLTLDVNSINVALVNAVKELKAENDKLKAENDQLKAENKQIDSRLTNIEKIISASAMK